MFPSLEEGEDLDVERAKYCFGVISSITLAILYFNLVTWIFS